MAKRVYISFDYDHDDDLKTLLVGQAKLPGSPFEIADWSIKEPVTSNWKDTARKRIRAVDVVAVICGQYTHTATGVAAEVSIAQEEGIPYSSSLAAQAAATRNRRRRNRPTSSTNGHGTS
jgi:hypothetical protein